MNCKKQAIEDIENMVLASFLYANDVGEDIKNAFLLNADHFTSSYRRATAAKINDETNGDRFYGFLSHILQEETGDTSFEQDFIDILNQTPMPFSAIKRYVEQLEISYKERIAKAFR
jgi:hypothetical protein